MLTYFIFFLLDTDSLLLGYTEDSLEKIVKPEKVRDLSSEWHLTSEFILEGVLVGNADKVVRDKLY